MREFDDKFYLGGHFSAIDSKVVNQICYYDGSQFYDMEMGVDAPVLDIEVYQNDIYIGGYFELAGFKDAHYIARWGLPIGVEEHLKEKDALVIYPNPSSGHIAIEMAENSSPKLSIFNSKGLLVFNHSYKDVYRIDIDLPLESGIYLIKVCVDGSVSDHKLLIE